MLEFKKKFHLTQKLWEGQWWLGWWSVGSPLSGHKQRHWEEQKFSFWFFGKYLVEEKLDEYWQKTRYLYDRSSWNFRGRARDFHLRLSWVLLKFFWGALIKYRIYSLLQISLVYFINYILSKIKKKMFESTSYSIRRVKNTIGYFF